MWTLELGYRIHEHNKISTLSKKLSPFIPYIL